MYRALRRVALLAVVAAGWAHGCSRDERPKDLAVEIPVPDAQAPDAPAGDVAPADSPADSAKDVAIDVEAPPVPGAKWQLVPGSEFTGPECWHFQAIPGTLTFPKLDWKPCGAGCDLADVVPGYPVELAGSVSASTTQGEAHVRLKFLMKDDVSTKLLTRVVRLVDGVTLAALLRDDYGKGTVGRCFMGASEYSPLFVDVIGPEPQNMTLQGLASADGEHAWTWAQPAAPLAAAPPGKGGVTTDTAWILYGAGGVYALLDMAKNEWTTLEAPSTCRFAGGDGDLVIWTEASSERIRGWAPDGKGARTLLEAAPNKSYLVRPSKTRLVGVAVEPDFETTLSTTVRFWHMPRTYSVGPTPTVLPVSASEVLVVGTVLRTWGDFVAVTALDHPKGSAIDYGAIWLLVANLVTGKAWRVEAAPGYALQATTWTLDDTWLYFAETLPGVKYEKSLLQLRRIRLSELDSWGMPTP